MERNLGNLVKLLDELLQKHEINLDDRELPPLTFTRTEQGALYIGIDVSGARYGVAIATEDNSFCTIGE